MAYNQWSLDLLESQVFDGEMNLSLCSFEDDSLYVDMAGAPSSINGLHEQFGALESKSPQDWNGDDCFDWAIATCHKKFLSCSSSNLDVFKLVNGKELLNYNEAEFTQLVDRINGPFLYENFQEFKKRFQNDYSETSSVSYTTLNNMTSTECSSGSFEDYLMHQDSEYTDYRSNLNSSFEDSSFSNSFVDQKSFHSPVNDNSSSSDYSLFPEHNYDMSYYSNDCSKTEDFSMNNLSLQEDYQPNNHSFEEASSSSSQHNYQPFENQEASVDGACGIDIQSNSSFDIVNSRHWFNKMPAGGTRKNRIRSPKVWEFVHRLLQDPRSNPLLVKWEDRENGIFRLVQKETVAQMWGNRTGSTPYTYESFARLLRHYYKSKTLMPVREKQMVYRFGPEILKDL